MSKPKAGKPMVFSEYEHVSIAAAAAKMLPRDAVAVVHVSSPAMVMHRVTETAVKFFPPAAMILGLDPLLSPTGLRARDVDLTGDVAVAIRFGENGFDPTIVIPSKKAEDAAITAAMEAVAVGDYVALSPTVEPKEQSGALPLAAKMLDGDVSVRVDMKKVLAAFGPKLWELLDPKRLAALDPTVPASMFEGMAPAFAELRKRLEAAVRLDLALSFRDGNLELAAVIEFDSEVWTGPEGRFDLLQTVALRGADMIGYANVADWADHAGVLQDALQNVVLPANDQLSTDQFRKMTTKLMDLYRSVGSEVAVAYRADPTDLGVLVVGRGGEPRAFRKALVGHFVGLAEIDPRGVSILGDSQVFGMTFANFRLRDSLPQRQATVGGGGADDLVYLVAGDGYGSVEHVRDAVQDKARYSLPLLEAVQGLCVKPRMFFAIDFRSLMRAFAKQSGLGAVAAGKPVLMWSAVGGSGKRIEAQFKMSLLELGDIMSSLQKGR